MSPKERGEKPSDKTEGGEGGGEDEPMVGEQEDGEMVPEEEEQEFTPAEILALDRQLDQLNAVLDVIEQRNDDINGQLKDLLESTKQARMDVARLNQGTTTTNKEEEDESSSREGQV